MDKIRVAIADDNKLMADVLEEIIQQDQDMEIVGKASDGEEAYQLIRSEASGCHAAGYYHAQTGWIKCHG